MAADRDSKLTLKELAALSGSSRREFLKRISIGSTGLLLFDRFLVRGLQAQPSQDQTQPDKMVFSMVVVDFNKCTGCRTCETVCSSFNNKVSVNGRELPGLGNPALSNIRVYPYNPDVDVPVTCLMCEDAPCIAACPVEPDPQTKHRAIYREGRLPVLRSAATDGRALQSRLAAGGIATSSTVPVHPSLEDIFLDVVEKAGRP